MLLPWIRSLRTYNPCNAYFREMLQEQEERRQKEQEARRRHAVRAERKRLGTTASGKLLDMDLLDFLTSLGVNRLVAAQALKQTSNSYSDAVDLVTHPESAAKLELDLLLEIAKKVSRRREEAATTLIIGQALLDLVYPEHQVNACQGAVQNARSATLGTDTSKEGGDSQQAVGKEGKGKELVRAQVSTAASWNM